MGFKTLGINIFFMSKRPRSNSWVKNIPRYVEQAANVYSTLKQLQTKDVAVGHSNPANDAITSQRDIARVTSVRKRKSKKAKRRLKRKTAFRKKVTKALATKQSMHTWYGRANTTIVQTLGGANWNTTPYQIVVGANGLSLSQFPRFVMGECNYDGAGGVLSTGFSQSIRNFFAKLQTRWNASDIAPPNAFNFHAGCMVTHEELNLAMDNVTSNPYNVDIYEMVAARDMTFNDTYHNPQAAWNQCLESETTAFSSGTTAAINVLPTNYGVTPYDAPNFGKHWKILSKTRIYLAAGQTTAMQFQNKPYFWREDKAQQLGARKGITKHIMFVIASEIGFDLPSGVATDCLKYAISRQIHFKFPASVANLTNGVVAVMGQEI